MWRNMALSVCVLCMVTVVCGCLFFFLGWLVCLSVSYSSFKCSWLVLSVLGCVLFVCLRVVCLLVV